MAKFIPDPQPVYTEDWKKNPDAEMIVFCGREMLLRTRQDKFFFPRVAELDSLNLSTALSIGFRDGRPCFAVDLPSVPDNLSADMRKVEVRLAVGHLESDAFSAGSRARELLHWRRQHRFCGRCGKPLGESQNDIALVCPFCGERFYPQLAPAVIVAVTRGDEILLAHNRKFLPGIHGLIAGFVEAGENIEEAVHREILEETGVTVGNIRYLSSQCWPFPNSLMLGFTAEYVSGEAKPDGTELDTLGWFRADALPPIPPPGSIARKIIEEFKQKHANQSRGESGQRS